MANSWTTVRRHDNDRHTSPTVSRLVVLEFLTAFGIGLLSGIGWLVWTLARRVLNG